MAKLYDLTIGQISNICYQYGRCFNCTLFQDGECAVSHTPSTLKNIDIDLTPKAKYLCNDCNEFFDDPATIQECVGEFWGSKAYEDVPTCPNCGNTDFVELESYDNE